MNENTSKLIIKQIIDSQDDLVVILENSKIHMASHSFLNFFNISSVDDFNSCFKNFVECFFNHPSYFSAEKIPEGKTLTETLYNISEDERIVSMLSPKDGPHAFFITLIGNIKDYVIMKFTDITQKLIKSIMIENSHIPLFSNLNFINISHIVDMLNVKIFKADEIIVHMGTNGDAMYFILEGNVLVYNDNMQVSLKDGEFFGEIALIKDVPRTATVKALNDCRILELTTKDFTNFIEKKPELLKEIKKVADSRFEAV